MLHHATLLFPTSFVFGHPCIILLYILQGHAGLVKYLTLGDGVHCEVDTLCRLLVLVCHPEGIQLRLETGCVLEAATTTIRTNKKSASTTKHGDSSCFHYYIYTKHILRKTYHFVIMLSYRKNWSVLYSCGKKSHHCRM